MRHKQVGGRDVRNALLLLATHMQRLLRITPYDIKMMVCLLLVR